MFTAAKKSHPSEVSTTTLCPSGASSFCCESTGYSNNAIFSLIIGLLDIVIDDVDELLGLTCADLVNHTWWVTLLVNMIWDLKFLPLETALAASLILSVAPRTTTVVLSLRDAALVRFLLLSLSYCISSFFAGPLDSWIWSTEIIDPTCYHILTHLVRVILFICIRTWLFRHPQWALITVGTHFGIYFRPNRYHLDALCTYMDSENIEMTGNIFGVKNWLDNELSQPCPARISLGAKLISDVHF